MKHIFIYNPIAGQDSRAAIEVLKEKMKAHDGELAYEFYPTKSQGDATVYVRHRCQNAPEEQLRFYACGGDGTANEVLHGLVGFENASMTCYPCGSGNDYVKYYGGAEKFWDIEALLCGTERRVDIMRVGHRYSLNVTNFGFDTAVARTMTQVRHKKLIGGRNAYTTGIVKALFTSMRNRCVVSVDGEVLNEKGEILLCTVANGKYVGGAYCCAPNSLNDDGLLEICLVKPLSRLTLVKLIGVYKEGKHLGDPRFKDLIVYRRGKRVDVKAPEGFGLTLDGEIVDQSEFSIEICPGALRFVVPAIPVPDEAESVVPKEAVTL